MNIFSTRELSLLIWTGLALAAMVFSKNIRGSFKGIFKLLFGKTIGTILLMLTAYVSILIFLLHKLTLWDTALLKDTIFWFLTTALVLFFTINKARDASYFKDIVKENLKWSVAIEFIVNFYTFSLPTELILMPAMVFLAMLQAYSQTDSIFK